MLTVTGQLVTREYGAPSIRDIAVQLMRLGRFAGASEVFWPVGLHSLLVADLCPAGIEHHALLHDASECVVNDVPRPMKTPEAKALEAVVTARIYAALGLELPTPAEAELVHAADMRAVHAEGRSGWGPRGFEETQPGFVYEEDVVRKYLAIWVKYGRDLNTLMKANGPAALYFESRLRRAIARHQNGEKMRQQYTKAA